MKSLDVLMLLDYRYGGLMAKAKERIITFVISFGESQMLALRTRGKILFEKADCSAFSLLK